MARRRAPTGRFSWRKAARLQRIEAVLVLGSLALIAAGVLAVVLRERTEDRLLTGASVPATISSSASYSGLRLGRFATLSYTVGGRAYTAQAQYDSSQMTEGRTVLIRADPGDPGTFVVGETAFGSSLGLWLRGLLGTIAAAAGFAGLLVFAAAHQWRYDEDD